MSTGNLGGRGGRKGGREKEGESIPIIQSAAAAAALADDTAVDNALRVQKYSASPETTEGEQVDLEAAAPPNRPNDALRNQ